LSGPLRPPGSGRRNQRLAAPGLTVSVRPAPEPGRRGNRAGGLGPLRLGSPAFARPWQTPALGRAEFAPGGARPMLAGPLPHGLRPGCGPGGRPGSGGAASGAPALRPCWPAPVPASPGRSAPRAPAPPGWLCAAVARPLGLRRASPGPVGPCAAPPGPCPLRARPRVLCGSGRGGNSGLPCALYGFARARSCGRCGGGVGTGGEQKAAVRPSDASWGVSPARA